MTTRTRNDEEEDEDSYAGLYEMGEVFETSLSAEHWSDSEGRPLPVGSLSVEEVSCSIRISSRTWSRRRNSRGTRAMPG